jgi:hypothetical protein
LQQLYGQGTPPPDERIHFHRTQPTHHPLTGLVNPRDPLLTHRATATSPPLQGRRRATQDVEHFRRQRELDETNTIHRTLVLQYDDLILKQHQFVVLMNAEPGLNDFNTNRGNIEILYAPTRIPWNVDTLDGTELIHVTHGPLGPEIHISIERVVFAFPLKQIRFLCRGPVRNFQNRITTMWCALTNTLVTRPNDRAALLRISQILAHPFEAEGTMPLLNDGLTNRSCTCFLATGVQCLSSSKPICPSFFDTRTFFLINGCSARFSYDSSPSCSQARTHGQRV